MNLRIFILAYCQLSKHDIIVETAHHGVTGKRETSDLICRLWYKAIEKLVYF